MRMRMLMRLLLHVLGLNNVHEGFGLSCAEHEHVYSTVLDGKRLCMLWFPGLGTACEG